MKRMLMVLTSTALLAPTATAAAQTVRAEAVAEGARVWSAQCTRCHTPRPSAERTDRQWQTIIAHMRARANLTRSDASAVAAFLQATNAPPVATSTVGGAAPQAGPDDTGADDARAPEPIELSAAERAALLRYLASLMLW